MVKSKEKQLELIDHIILPIYGFKSLQDYQYTLSSDLLSKDNTLVERINQIIPLIKQCFPVKSFNFYKINDHITDYKQAFSILKKCLEISSVPYELSYKTKNNIKNKHLRLVNENSNVVLNYNKMSSRRISLDNVSNPNLPLQRYNDLIKTMKFNTYTYIIPIEPFVLQTSYIQKIRLSTSSLNIISGWIKDLRIELLDNNGELYKNAELEYELSVMASCIHHGIIKNNNLIPYEVVLPFGVSYYHSSELTLMSYGKNQIESTKSIKLTIIKSLEPLLTENYPELEIPWGSYPIIGRRNCIRCMNGMLGMAYTIDDVTPSTHIYTNPFVTDNFEFKKIHSLNALYQKPEIHSFNEYDVMIGNHHREPISQDIVVYRSESDPYKQYCIDTCSNVIHFSQSFPDIADLASDLIITFNQPIIGDVHINLQRGDLLLLSYQTEDHQTYKITNFNEIYTLNIRFNFQLNILIDLPNQTKPISYQLKMINYELNSKLKSALVSPQPLYKINSNKTDIFGFDLTTLKSCN